ncbi:Protein kinase-like domain containing protein [Elaphomyces granulatus]
MFSSALKSFSSNISSQYQISPEPSVISGPWKIHDGKKKSMGSAASIFIFDRKTLETRSSGFGGRSNAPLKKSHDEVVERLKREASNLARLRHPSILQMLEPLEETRSGGLMFATEPITASLAGLLQEKDEQGGIGSSRYMVEGPNGTRRRRDMDIDELEIQKGLLQIAKGLEFLHYSAGLVHGNLSPEAIYINAKSDWKISGLAFAGPPDDSDANSTLPPLSLSEVLYQDPRLPRSVQLNLDYTSPDFVLDSNVTTSADLFSLGLVIIAIYNSPHTSPIQSHSNTATYKKLLNSPSTTPSQSNDFLCKKTIPKDLLNHVLPRLIARRPAQRITAREFQQSQYFDNILVSTIRFLESLPAKTPNEKSQFMRGLQRVLPEFPVSVLEKKVLVALLEETKDRELLSLILQNVFGILKRLPNGRRTFPETVIPRLKEIFLTGGNKERDTARDAGLMVVLENMNIIAENSDLRLDILPIIQLGMESSTHTLVEAAMKCLPVMLPVLDFSTVKNEVFPPIAATFSKTNSLSVKIRGLEAFVVLCGGDVTNSADDLSGVVEDKKVKPSTSSILDKYTVQEKLVPLLNAIKTKEPAVMMAVLNVFRQVGNIADTEFLASEVLPTLWSFSLGPLLNLQQFEQFIALIKLVSTKIEREQKKKLQELSSREDSAASFAATQSAFGVSTEISPSDVDGTSNGFERLVLGRNGTSDARSDTLWNDWGSKPSAVKAPSQPNQVTSPAFSWSSNAIHSTNRPSLTQSVVSSQAGEASRSITPDFKMSAYPSLEPSKRQNPSLAAPAFQPSTVVQKPPSNPSLATLGSMRTAFPTPTLGQTNVPLQNANYSAFTIPPPPPGNNIQQSRNISVPPSQDLWAANAVQQPFQHSATTTKPSGPPKKQGLDKYESLL